MGFDRSGRNWEQGQKNRVFVKLDGQYLDRSFPNKGKAIDYLRHNEDLTKEEIKQRVRFEFSGDDDN